MNNYILLALLMTTGAITCENCTICDTSVIDGVICNCNHEFHCECLAACVASSDEAFCPRCEKPLNADCILGAPKELIQAIQAKQLAKPACVICLEEDGLLLNDTCTHQKLHAACAKSFLDKSVPCKTCNKEFSISLESLYRIFNATTDPESLQELNDLIKVKEHIALQLQEEVDVRIAQRLANS